MQLRSKFSIFLAGCVISSVLLVTVAQYRVFLSGQEASLIDFQTSLAHFGKKQLETQMRLLYAEWEPVTLAEHPRLDEVLNLSPSVFSAQIWENGRLIQASAASDPSAAPPAAGRSPWFLSASPTAQSQGAISWNGRFGNRSAVINFRSAWLDQVIEASHGAEVELVAPSGQILHRHSSGSKRQSQGIEGSENFDNPKVLEEMANIPESVAESRDYNSKEGVPYLGTVLKLGTDPETWMVIKTKRTSIESVLLQVYVDTLKVTAIALGIAILAGIFFSTTLTAPIKELTRQIEEVGRGNWDAMVSKLTGRSDELGFLARSFNRMIDELQVMRNELKRSERLAALGKFSAVMAHEIKNPLVIVMGDLHMAKKKLQKLGPDAEDSVKDLELAQNEVMRANSILMRLLKFSRRQNAPKARIDLNDQARQSLASLGPLLEQHDVRLESSFPDQGVFILANADEIHEVLTNLIQNSIDAMIDAKAVHSGPNSRKLVVSLRGANNEAVMQLTDNGHGIPADVMEHIFEPFFTTKEIGKGTGLGLAVCHGIILNHEGKIEVSSPPGQGTTFTLRLPLDVTGTEEASLQS